MYRDLEMIAKWQTTQPHNATFWDGKSTIKLVNIIFRRDGWIKNDFWFFPKMTSVRASKGNWNVIKFQTTPEGEICSQEYLEKRLYQERDIVEYSTVVELSAFGPKDLVSKTGKNWYIIEFKWTIEVGLYEYTSLQYL